MRKILLLSIVYCYLQIEEQLNSRIELVWSSISMTTMDGIDNFFMEWAEEIQLAPIVLAVIKPFDDASLLLEIHLWNL